MRSPQLIAAVLAGFAFCQADPQAGPRPQDPVTVFASRTGIGDSTKIVQVITREEIARSSARTIADVLALLPGVDVHTRSLRLSIDATNLANAAWLDAPGEHVA